MRSAILYIAADAPLDTVTSEIGRILQVDPTRLVAVDSDLGVWCSMISGYVGLVTDDPIEDDYPLMLDLYPPASNLNRAALLGQQVGRVDRAGFVADRQLRGDPGKAAAGLILPDLPQFGDTPNVPHGT